MPKVVSETDEAFDEFAVARRCRCLKAAAHEYLQMAGHCPPWLVGIWSLNLIGSYAAVASSS